MATFEFRGTIVNTSGEPQNSKLVTVYFKTTLRDYDARQPTTISDANGHYVVNFTWSDVEAGDFEVVVAESAGGEIGRSVVLFDLRGGTHQVDVVTGDAQSYRGRSEFRRIAVAVSPLAKDGSSPIPYMDLAFEDVDFLANKAKYPPSVIALFIHAHRLAALLSDTVPADAFFGMLREGLPPRLAELLAQGPEIQRAALDRAVARNLFDHPGAAALNGYIVALDAAAIDSAVHVSSGSKSKFRNLIDSADRGSAEGAESVQRAFLTKYAAHEGDLDSFWADVIADTNLGQDVHDTYKWCLQIQALCSGHQPLIDALQAKRNDPQDPINSFADLATIDVEGWKTLIGNGFGLPWWPREWTTAEKVQRYAETIARLVSDAVPTRVVHERIKRDSLELSGADDLDTFFTANPNFDLRSNVFQRYLSDNPTALDAVPTTDGRRDACAENIKAIQRLSYVAPRGSTYDTIKPLYQAGIRSAADIDAMGPIAFVRRFAADFGEGEIGKIRARAVYDRASHVYSITLALISKYAPIFNKIGLTNVLNSYEVPSSQPDLEALFGSMDFCGCEHCRSVYSPAAYMVDLLQFLSNESDIGENNALAALKARRPDITKIQLSCANASTQVPYIDLVNELLETRVSKGSAPSDDYWQTTWTAEELALRPEHRDDGAYLELAAVAYPWNLPFDLHRTEADLYLEELEVPRRRIDQPSQADLEGRGV